MANSGREKVLDNIVAALGIIATGSGYNYTIGDYRLGLKHFQEVPEDKFPAAFVAGADEARTNVSNRGFKSILQVSIIAFVKVADSSDPAQLERDLSKFIEDITKALYLDPTRGGNATFTEVRDIKTDKGSWIPYAGCEMVVACDYRGSFATP